MLFPKRHKVRPSKIDVENSGPARVSLKSTALDTFFNIFPRQIILSSDRKKNYIPNRKMTLQKLSILKTNTYASLVHPSMLCYSE